MNRRCAWLICFWIALLAVPRIGFGQVLPQNDWSILQVLRFGDKVEVTSRNNKSIVGEFGHAIDTALTIYVDRRATEFDRGDIVKVSRVLPKHVGKMVLRGADIGTRAGAAIGAAAGEDCSRKREFLCIDRSVTIPIGAAVVGVPGAATGLIVGLAKNNRLPVYDINAH